VIRADGPNRSAEPPDNAPGGADVQRSAALDAMLGGSLPCFVCGYELKGLTVRGVCPECGTAVRATILHTVDPDAEEIQPVAAPRLVTAGLVLWPMGALATAAMLWVNRINEVSGATGGIAASGTVYSRAALAGVLVSAIGALMLVRPARAIPKWKSAAVVLSLAGYAAAAIGLRLVEAADLAKAPAYVSRAPDPERLLGRLIFGAGVLVVLLGMRPMARELVRRSLAMRQGRVDRQTLAAMAAVTLIGMLGDGLRWLSLASGVWSWLSLVGTALVIISSLLLTLGVASAIVDGVRIGASVRTPAPSIRSVVGGG
jgi:hypothetical protein